MNPAHDPFGDTLRAITALGRIRRGRGHHQYGGVSGQPKARYITGTVLTVDGGANA